MKNFKLVECSDHDEEYGLLVVKNDGVTVDDIQDKIYEFKNSYKAYGYSSLKEMREDGYKTIDDLFANGDVCWTIDDLMEEAFPKSWKVSLWDIDDVVEC